MRVGSAIGALLRRPAAALWIAAIAIAAPSLARGQLPEHVIEPGHEAAILQIAGGSREIAGCTVAGVEIARDRVVARYACAEGAPTIVLRHPDDSAGRREGSFALEPSLGAPPALIEAVAARARAASGLMWTALRDSPPEIVRNAAGPKMAGMALGLALLLAIAITSERRASRSSAIVWALTSLATLTTAQAALLASPPPPRDPGATVAAITISCAAWALGGAAAGRAVAIARPSLSLAGAGVALVGSFVAIAAIAAPWLRGLSVYDAYAGALIAASSAIPALRSARDAALDRRSHLAREAPVEETAPRSPSSRKLLTPDAARDASRRGRIGSVIVLGHLGRLGLALGAFLVAAGAAEFGARLAGLGPAKRGALEQMHLAIDDDDREWQAAALFPDVRDRGWFARGPADRAALGRSRGLRRFVHIGDSMLLGPEVSDEVHFTRLLERARPGEEHLNLGVSSVGTDVELVIVRRWLARLEPDVLVVHVFDNDLREIDQVYASCGGGPWIDWSDPALPERCGAEPRWAMPWRLRHALDPAPASIRVLALRSALARAIERAIERARPTRQLEVPETERDDRVRRALEAIRALAERRRVPLRVVIMPRRPDLPDDPALHTRLRAAVRAAGIEPLDPGGAFGSEALFQSEPGNPHLSVAGHARFARWLTLRL